MSLHPVRVGATPPAPDSANSLSSAVPCSRTFRTFGGPRKMRRVEEPLQKARQTVIGFKRRYGIAWEDFHELEKFEDKYRGLTARRWGDVVKGEVEPHKDKRQLTIDLAALM